MIASLTFTYGDNRFDIFKYKSKDRFDQQLRNSIDLNLLVFHNSPSSYVKRVKDSKLLDNFNFTFATIDGNYPSAFKQSLYYLKNRGVKKLIFMQDDVYSCTKNQDEINELISTIKDNDLPYINIEMVCNDPARLPVRELKHFNIIDTDTQYYRKDNGWPFDDSPYYSTLDFALEKIYDENYFSYPDIWSAEWYLRHKFNQYNIPRYVTDKGFFRRVNFVGRHSHNKEAEIKFLEENFT